MASAEAPSERATRLATITTGGAIAAVALSSALQMVLFLGKFGTDGGTDGVLAAYSLYVLVTVFAQGCRISGAAALGGDPARATETQFASTLVISGLVVAALMVVLRDPVAGALVGGTNGEAFDKARTAMPVLAAGVAAQFAAAAWATILGHRDRLVWAAVALVVGAVAAAITFVLLLGPAEEIALVWSTVASGVVSCVVMAVVAPPRWSRPTRLAATALLITRENVVPLFPTIVYTLSVAAAARSTDEQGALTLFSLAFLACSYLTSITSASIAIVETSGGRRAGLSLEDRLAQQVPGLARGALGLAGLGLGIAVVAAPSVVEAVAPSQLQGADPDLTRIYLLLLAPFVLAVIASNVAFPAWSVLGRAGHLNRRIGPLVVVHIVVSLAAGAALGVEGVSAATALPTIAFAWVCLRPGPGLPLGVLRGAAGVVVVAAVSFGIGAAVGFGAFSDAPAAATATALGTATYLGLGRLLRARAPNAVLTTSK